MAIRPEDVYAFIAAASANYPDGSAINAPSPLSLDGTPMDKEWLNDVWGFLQKLNTDANTTPSGNPDNVLASDYFNSMEKLFSRFLTFDDTGAINAYQLDAASGSDLKAYIDGMCIVFKAANINTGASTVQIEALGAKDITLPDGTALSGGEINGYIFAVYNSASNRFEILTSSKTFESIQYDAIVRCQDQKPASTNGGSSVAGSWVTRTLNTKTLDTAGIATLAANQVTLPAGTYDVIARSPGESSNGHRVRIYNATDAITLGDPGSSAHVFGTVVCNQDSIVRTRFTINASKAIEVQHRSSSAKASTGLGSPGKGITEVYAEVEFKRLAS